MKKIFIFLLLLFSAFLLILKPVPAKAQVACSDYTDVDLKQRCEDIESQIKEYEGKLEEAKKQESSLKENIDYLDNQIYLSKLRIQESEIIIEKRKQDIENLINKILLLEDRLDKNTKLFLKRINLSYRRGNLQPYMIFFGSGSIADKISRYKYLQTVQSADRKFLFKIQETKNSYAEQKQLVQEEKKALEAEKVVLEARKAEYNRQVAEKENLLAQTQDEEKVLSDSIANLQAQRASLMGGVASLGLGDTVCNGCSNDGANYFNQRDARWGFMKIANANCPGCANSTVARYGCALTSVAMVMKNLGVDINPGTVAANSNLFLKQDGYQWDYIIFSPNVANAYVKTYYGLSSWSDVDQKLSAGKWVIVHVSLGDANGHFVVLKSKNGNDYVMNDPYWGENLSFYSRYSGADQMLTYE